MLRSLTEFATKPYAKQQPVACAKQQPVAYAKQQPVALLVEEQAQIEY
jgi:hypothetical protein